MHKKVVCQNIVGDIRALSKTKKRGQTHVLKFEDIISDKKRVVRELFRSAKYRLDEYFGCC